jgi:hypothetical protein
MMGVDNRPNMSSCRAIRTNFETCLQYFLPGNVFFVVHSRCKKAIFCLMYKPQKWWGLTTDPAHTDWGGTSNNAVITAPSDAKHCCFGLSMPSPGAVNDKWWGCIDNNRPSLFSLHIEKQLTCATASTDEQATPLAFQLLGWCSSHLWKNLGNNLTWGAWKLNNQLTARYTADR